MDYDNIKLGLIGRFKVWRERREIEKDRKWHDSTENEISEIDYSAADQLAAHLLEQKRIKRATRDAAKLYKSTYGKNNDGVGKDDFIEDYLIKNGLKQKALPEPETSKKHSFMEKYPIEKSKEELAYEKANLKPEVYYKIGDMTYKTSFLFANWCFREINEGKDSPVPLTTNNGRDYIIQTEGMKPEKKYIMLNKLISTSLDGIGMDLAALGEQSSPDAAFPSLCRLASRVSRNSKKLYESGEIEEAITKLEKMTEKIFRYNKERLQQEQTERA